MTRALFDEALDAAREWYGRDPVLQDFVTWPGELDFVARPAHPLPVIPHLQEHPGAATQQTRRLRDALVALAPHVEWRHTYTEDEVGADFLQRYGWFELAGPDGHFRSDALRMTVGYWGAGLFYPWHVHAPEELYTVVSGQALFESEGDEPGVLGAGQTRFHESLQPHALTTSKAPVLTLVYWRGEGLAEAPRLGAA